MNSLTHRGDFAKAALDLHRLGADFGIYHCVNPGQISAMEVVAKMAERGLIPENKVFVKSETTGCRLSTQKLVRAGVKIREVHEAVDDAIKNWTSNV
jgi:dTDP-4-dehydrorhamnose reductase